MLNTERRARVRMVRTPTRLTSRSLVRAGLVVAAIVAAAHPADAQTRNGLCQTFQYPGAVATYAHGINNHGDIVGEYATSLEPEAERFSGFLRTADGQFRSIERGPVLHERPGDQRRRADCRRGRASGVHRQQRTAEPVLRGAVTGATDINNAGAIVGYYHISPEPGFKTHGFLMSGGGTTTIDFPAAPGDGHTWLGGINDHGKAVGWASGHSFTWLDGQTTRIKDFAGNFTEAAGINNDDKIIGAAGSNLRPVRRSLLHVRLPGPVHAGQRHQRQGADRWNLLRPEWRPGRRLFHAACRVPRSRSRIC